MGDDGGPGNGGPGDGGLGAARTVAPAIVAAFGAAGAAHGVSGAVHPDDHIFWYIHDQVHAADASGVAAEYIRSGRDTARFIKGILDEHNLAVILDRRADPGRPVTMLEFASGYGRVTRHAPAELPGIEVTACDVHPQAVEFVRGMGFAAACSSSVPEELALGRTFDVVFAYSFFTHMPRSSWARWLRALGRQVAPGGLLVFTAHGEVSQGLMGVGELEGDGFFFHAASEQADLSAAEYGNTVTAFEWVYAQVAASGMKLVQFRQATAGHHDVYVLRNDPAAVRYVAEAGEPAVAAGAGARQLRAELDAVHRSTSWRVTRPLRALGRALRGGG